MFSPGSELISSINIDGSGYKEYSTGPAFMISFARIENINFWITLDNGNDSRPQKTSFCVSATRWHEAINFLSSLLKYTKDRSLI